MAPKTKKAALADMLENLSESNFDTSFAAICWTAGRSRASGAESGGKNAFLQIADVRFLPLPRLELTGTRDTARPSAGAAGVDTTSDDQHFVDKYKLQLTDRVSHMDPILDRLLDRGVLQPEAYDTIRALPTSQKKMRELYCGCLKAGAASKDIFYQILLENEKFLIDDLNTKH
nr:NACHT, LRR and PYD domains-containing protein 1a-like [Labrus bergylta]